MNPLVSILIPCHNAAPWLAETLESALAQTWQNLEIIVVDDGSTDESLSVAQQFNQRNLQIIPQHNQGAAAARNRALEAAQGEVIQYLDADDMLAPDKIEQQMAMLQAHPNCLISGAWTRFHRHYEDAVFTPEPLWQDLEPARMAGEGLVRQLDDAPCCLVGTAIAHSNGWSLAHIPFSQ